MSRVLVDSGIEWIGKIPNDWDIQKVKYICNYYNGIGHEGEQDFDGKYILVNSRFISTEGMVKKYTENQLFPLYSDDICIVLSDLPNGKALARTFLVEYNNTYTLNQRIAVLRNSKINPKFLSYYLNRNQFFLNFDDGSNQTNLKRESVVNCPVLVPPIEEQKRIADYLDVKCSKIDKIIEDNNKAIELLEEYRKTIFNGIISKYSVTNYKLKYLISKKLQYGANASGIPYDEKLPRYVRITDIEDNKLKDNDLLSLPEEEAKDFILSDGDILFARSGGTVGKSFIYKSKYGNCAFAGYLIRAQFDDINLANYVYNYTNSTLYDEWKNSIFIQSTIQNIGADKYSIMPIPIPDDRSVIEAINKRISNSINKVDTIIEYRKKIIEKLEEYKKSLIYEVVTGKKEV